MIAPLKFDEILKVLVDHGVELILVGGVAEPWFKSGLRAEQARSVRAWKRSGQAEGRLNP